MILINNSYIIVRQQLIYFESPTHFYDFELHVILFNVSGHDFPSPVVAVEKGDQDSKVGRDPPGQNFPAERRSVQKTLQNPEDGNGAGEGLQGKTEGSLQQNGSRSRSNPLLDGLVKNQGFPGDGELRSTWFGEVNWIFL